MANFSGGVLQIDPGSVKDSHFSNASGDRLAVDKQEHAYIAGTNLGFAIGATPTTREEIVFVATAAATVLGFKALLNADGSSTAISFDLKKNGTTILSGTVDLTHSTGDRVSVAGSLSSTTLAAGDVLSVAMTVTSSTGAQGPYAWVILKEPGAPS